MAQANYDPCLAFTLKYEGGYVDHPSDPGGATNRGITFAVLKKWRNAPISKQDVRDLSEAEAARIYKANYWGPIKGDKLPLGVDLVTFDAGVNSGTGRAAKWLQRAAGVVQDGSIGVITLAAVAKANPEYLIHKVCAYRLGFVQTLRIWTTFGRGWAARIAANEATALAMLPTAGTALPRATAEAKTKAKQQTTAATGSVAGAGLGGADQTVSPEHVFSIDPALIWLGVTALAVLAVYLASRSIWNSIRAKALAEQAAKLAATTST